MQMQLITVQWPNRSRNFYSDCRNLNDQTRLGKAQTMDFESELKAREANLIGSRWAWHLIAKCGSSLSQPSQKHQEMLNCVSRYQNTTKILIHTNIKLLMIHEQRAISTKTEWKFYVFLYIKTYNNWLSFDCKWLKKNSTDVIQHKSVFSWVAMISIYHMLILNDTKVLTYVESW